MCLPSTAREWLAVGAPVARLRFWLKRRARSVLRPLLHRIGYDVVRYAEGHPLARRMQLLERYHIGVIFDVGANVGQYARELRQAGYRGRIVSFEPLEEAFSRLDRERQQDEAWEAYRIAVGDTAGTVVLNVAQNSQSSSLLEMLPAHVRVAPGTDCIRREEVPADTLASLIDRHRRPNERLMVKVDAQGYERRIVESAGPRLADVTGFQLEMSLLPLYQGETLLADMVQLMAALGFNLLSLEPGYADPRTGRLVQVDGVFFRDADRG